MNIHPVDSAIIFVYMAATIALGIWVGRPRKGEQLNTADYFLGGHQLPWWALLLSIVATETSTATFLSVPGLSFREGGNFSFLQLAGGFIIGRTVVAIVLLPLYFRGSLFTSYQLLDKQLGPATQRLASALFLAARTIGDALRLFLTALVLRNVLQLDMNLCILTVGVVTIVYTLFGGLRSVVWNDCVQFVVYIGGAIWALGVLIAHVPGSWRGLWSYGMDHHKFRVILWDTHSAPGTYSLGVGIVGGAFLALASHGTDHLVVQRLLASRTQRDGARALILSGVVVFAQFTLFLLIGVALSYFYATYPPDNQPEYDEVFVRFIVGNMQAGVVGVILAAVFAAAMSTQSSSLNASSSAAINDFYRPLLGKEVSESHLLWAGKIATLIFGFLQVAVAISTQWVGEAESRSTVNSVLEIAAFAYGPVLGLFFLAALPKLKRIVPSTSLTAFTVGLIVLVGLKLIPQWVPSLQLAGLWYTAVGSLVTLCVGVVDHAIRCARRHQSPHK